MTTRVQLKSRVAEAVMKERVGTGVTPADVDVLVEGDCDVYKPDGVFLCGLRRGGVPKELSDAAYPALHHIGVTPAYMSDNRGNYSGYQRSANPEGSSKQTRTRDDDGNIVRVPTAIVGYFDRMGGRWPFCRATAFTSHEVEKWRTIVPMIEAVDQRFAKDLPTRYAKQRIHADKVQPEYMITNTVFSTLTVNRNVIANVHTDKGDFKDGIGVITVLRRGHYGGGWLVFPEFRVAADLQDCDLIYFNSHELHAVTPLFDESEDAERISVVYYLRTRMTECLPHEEELARARKRTEDQQWGDDE